MSLSTSHEAITETVGLTAGTGPAPVVLDASPPGRLVVPGAGSFAGARFERLGSDLVVQGRDGTETVVREYFGHGERADLWSEGGQVLRGGLVERLAGPLAPGQVAQEGTSGSSPVGHVTAVEGEAVATRVDGSRAVLAVDSPVYQGDVLETGSGALLHVVFVDETSFSLGERARMVVDELVYDPSSGQGSGAFSVVEGLFVFVSGEVAEAGPDALTLTTPVATIGIRGTGLGIKAALEGLQNLISLLVDPDGKLGHVVVSNAGGTVTLDEANETTAVTSFEAGPSVTFLLAPQQIQSLFGSTLDLSPYQGLVPEETPDTEGEEGGAGEDAEGGGGDEQVVKVVLADEAGNVIGAFDIAFAQALQEIDNPLLDILTKILAPPEEGTAPTAETEGTPDLLDQLPTPVVDGGGGGGEAGRKGIGTDGDDNIDAVQLGVDGQANLLAGFGGNDTITGGNLEDFIFGGDGNDILFGGAGNDVVDGGTGNDVFVGGTGAGNDTYSGGDGIDSVSFESTSFGVTINLLSGFASGAETGFDTLEGIENASGGAGADIITGNALDNSLYGDAGNDLLIGGAGNDILNGADGTDAASFTAAAAGVTVDLRISGPQFVGTDQGDDTFDSIENLFGSNFRDVLHGNASDNRFESGFGDDDIFGDDGNDVLIGGFGNDSVLGGAGDDSLNGGFGNDLINGEGGNDTLIFDSTFGTVTADLANNTSTGAFGSDVVTGIENVDGSALFGFASIIGNNGVNILKGGSGEDEVFGGGGDDSLFGNSSDDILQGGAGNDLLDGGFGNDTADFSDIGNGVNVNLNTGVATGASTDTLISIEDITGSAFADVLTGNGLANFIGGGNGADDIDGLGGDDRLFGDDGNDSVLGGLGNDSLEGGQGDDLLEGEDGNDVLDGAQGNDNVFGFAGDDVIMGSDLAGGAGNDSFNGGAGNDTLIYDTTNSDLDINLQTGTATATDASEGNDVVSNIERVDTSATNGDNTLTGRNGTDVELIGGSGDDFITGQDGDDILRGGAGNDNMTGGTGADTFFGGTGDNQLNGDANDVANYSQSSSGIGVSFSDQLDVTHDGGGFTDNLFGITRIVGSSFNDVFDGGGASETFLGGFGDDTFIGTGGADSYAGGFGQDLLDFSGAGGVVTIDLGAGTATGFGADTFTGIENATGGAGDDAILGDDFANVLSGGAGNDAIDGGLGDDVLNGQGGDDVLDGDDGNDSLSGGAGDDAFTGGAGFDLVSFANASGGVTVDLENNAQQAIGGGEDNDTFTDDFEGAIGSGFADTIAGNALDNQLFGGAGNDVLTGVGGADFLDGGAGEDSLDGGGGTDVLFGGADNDALQGSGGADNLFGDAGEDVLGGGTGNDSLSGGANNDTLNGDDNDDVLDGGSGDDALDGGTGVNTASFSSIFAGVTVNLGAGTATGQGTDALANIQNVIGSVTSDTITGDGGANSINGNGGLDSLFGGGGDDILRGVGLLNGQGGNDSLVSGFGTVTLIGGAGNDILDGSFGSDTADYSGGPAVNVNLLTSIATGAGNDTLIAIENVIGSGGADTIVGNAFANSLNGGDGDDQIDGGAGSDNLRGGNGADRLIGGSEGDTLQGDANNDILEGGDGDDFIVGDAGNDTIDGGAGFFDTLSYFNGATGGVTVDLGLGGAQAIGGGFGTDTISGIERVTGTTFDDRVRGDASDNSFDGQAGNDVLEGADGNDILNGGAGNDQLNGGAGNDTVFDFGGGNDLLEGGLGNDTLQEFGGGTDILRGGDGDDTLLKAGGDGSLDGGVGDDTLQVQSPAGAIVVNGGDGDDSLSFFGIGTPLVVDLGVAGPQAVGAGSVTLLGVENLTGGFTFDTFTGDAGGNRLDGSSGDDVLNGGGGDDVLVGGSGNDLLNGGTGNDVADYSGAGSGVVINLNAAGGIQSLTGGLGTDTFVSIEGVRGGGFRDVLIGDDVANFLEGGFGIDILQGGLGADSFAYAAPGHGGSVFVDEPRAIVNGVGVFGDIIFDFQTGEDRILVDATAFGLPEGPLAGANFRTIAAAYNGTNAGVGAGIPVFVFSQEDNTLYFDNDTSIAGYSVIADLVTGSVNAGDIEVTALT